MIPSYGRTASLGQRRHCNNECFRFRSCIVRTGRSETTLYRTVDPSSPGLEQLSEAFQGAPGKLTTTIREKGRLIEYSLIRGWLDVNAERRARKVYLVEDAEQPQP